MQDEENRYETQRSAQSPEEQGQQRETRQVLNRLRELAQRQEDLNRQMRELESALQQAREEAKREELKRQLARLRDQQQQMLRDTDELRDRMDQPENQQRMADSRQQLEQTREDVRRASEALDQGKVPQAEASGARAGEQLKNLRDEFRKNASGQFNDAMTQMRQEARQLDQNQQDLSQKLAEADKTEQRSLRDSGKRQEVAEGLKGQKQQLDKLLDDMRKTVEESEQAEPLLSKQLYDTIRDTRHDQTDQSLELSRQLLERGFVEEARKAEKDAGTGVTKLRQGVEKAADSVLGDETEALRRARGQLDELARELDREMRRNGGGGLAATQPATAPSRGGSQVARNNPTTRGSGGQEDEQQQPGEGQPGGEQGEGRQEVARADSQQPGSSQQGQQGRQRGQQGPGQQGQGQQQGAGQQPGEGQQQAQSPGAGSQPSDSQQANGGSQPGRDREGQAQQGRGQQQPGGEQARAGGLRGQRGDRAGANGRGARNDQPGGGDLRQLAGGDPNGRGGATATAGGGNEQFAGRDPLTGEGFREWSDRLRDVEEMVGDPRLRAEAARIRDRARQMRQDINRHSLAPNWDMVRDTIGRPLVELRDAVSQELLRRESAEALVPIDREPVPPKYAEEVKRYYERLGTGGKQ